VLLLAVLASCGSKNPYACTADSQCVRGGVEGTCAMQGFCAFPDTSCDGGLRYEANAGEGLANTCTTSLIDGGTDPGQPALCIKDVAFGRRFGCVLKQDSTIWCSGANGNGELGFGLAGVTTSTPMQVRDISTNVITDASAIGTGRHHACAVRANGTVWCWGANESGQLGNGTATQSAAAVQVQMADMTPLTGMVEVKLGFNHSCARAEATGQVFCWGAGSEGQLGDGTMAAAGRSRAAPVLVAAAGAPFAGALDLQVGASHGCVRKGADEMWCWGKNNDGELGDTTAILKTVPVQVGTAKNIGTSLWSTCRVNTDTSISCHGWNRAAAFGTGIDEGFNDTGDYLMPVKALASVGGSVLTGAKQVAMGSGMCALMTDGSVRCTGDGIYGQNGTGAPRRVLTAVVHADGSPLVGVDRLVAKWPHVCAHKITGGFECWGRNAHGELGDGTFTNRAYPSALQASCP
jgi:alpha-tubulin suppressor-like RCC1 family protein